MNTQKKLSLTADLEDYCVGIGAQFNNGNFSGAGIGWFNYETIDQFCDELREIVSRKRNAVELIGGLGEQSDFLETLGLRCYSLDKSSGNGGLVGLHVTLADEADTYCRAEEILKVSGELQVANYHILQFADDLMLLMRGDLNAITLWGDGRL